MSNNYNFIEIENTDCSFLGSNDRCFCLMEYDSAAGYSHSAENQIIFNLKKPLNADGQRYKKRAIDFLCKELSNLFSKSAALDKYIFVPIPTSKSKKDPTYDDRIIKILKCMEVKIGIKYIEVLDRIQTILPQHKSNTPRDPSNHMFMFNVPPEPLENKTIILLDDVITSGSTYKQAKNIITTKVKNCDIIGLFIAKTKNC